MKTNYKTLKEKVTKYAVRTAVAGTLALGIYDGIKGINTYNQKPELELPTITQETRQSINETHEKQNELERQVAISENNRLNELKESVRQKYEENTRELNRLEVGVLDNYNQAISDGKFTLEEQQKIYDGINVPKDYANQNNLQISKPLRNLERRLNKNLNGIDLGKPELQKDLEKQEIKVNVEPSYSIGEALLNCGIIMASGVTFYGLVMFSSEK